jgi:Leucine-rich repeat (LRR) protein
LHKMGTCIWPGLSHSQLKGFTTSHLLSMGIGRSWNISGIRIDSSLDLTTGRLKHMLWGHKVEHLLLGARPHACGMISDVSFSPLWSHVKSIESVNYGGENIGNFSCLSGVLHDSLERLDLTNVKVEYAQCMDLSGLTSLKHIQLCKLDVINKHITTTTTTTAGCDISIILCKLSKLEVLTLSGLHSCITGQVTGFSTLVNLTHLSISNCQISGNIEAAFSSLKLLNVLELNQFNRPSSIAPGCWLFGSIKVLSNMRQLRRLSLVGCPKIEGDIKELSHLTQLQRCELVSCKMIRGDLSSISTLTKLTKLLLSGTGIAGISISSLLPLVKLKRCEITDISFGDVNENIRSIQNLFPNMICFRANNLRFGDDDFNIQEGDY